MPVLDAVEAVVTRELERVGVPGLTLGILHEGRVETRAWGVASVDTGLPLRPEAAFRIASITKPFTAALVLALGLDLDEEVVPGEGIALRHLLSHSSGLDCELPGLERYGSLHELDLAGVRRWARPGELWSYSNLGYWLAGAAVERATGSAFEDAMRAGILEPLGLARTTFEVDEDLVGHAHGEIVASAFPRVRRPSGGLVSTVDDLLRFAKAHLDGPYGAALEPVVDAVGCRWGLGWGLGRRLALHYGGYGGFATLLLLVPERRFAFVALTNDLRGREAIDPVADATLELVLGAGRGRPEAIRLPAEDVSALAGRYRQAELEATVVPDGDGLVVTVRAYDVSRDVWESQPPLRALPVGGRTFRFADADELFDFPREGLARFGGRLAERT